MTVWFDVCNHHERVHFNNLVVFFSDTLDHGLLPLVNIGGVRFSQYAHIHAHGNAD